MLGLKHIRLLGTLWLVLAESTAAQTPVPGTCAPPTAKAVLNINNVNATIFNAGISEYEVPSGSDRFAIQTTDVWFGGFVNEELRVAGERWGGWELWPGPLNPGALPPDPTDCSEYDRIFEITKDDLEQYDQLGTVSDDLREWPWDLGAPVIDGDGIQGNYDLEAGDRPELIGQQRYWWVMNDVGNEHGESRSSPLGIEVHGSAAAAVEDGQAINNTTIHSFRVINRNSVAIDSMFMGIYSEADLNWRKKIFIGVDTTIGMSYAYNPHDEDHAFYEGAPPAIGLVQLKGWPSDSDGLDNDYDEVIDEQGEEAGLSHFIWWGVDEDIHSAREKYNTMTGYFRYGTPLTFGGDGREGSVRTRFQWPGDPVTGAYWSAVNIDSTGVIPRSLGRPGSVTSFGPVRLEPGGSAEFTFAYVWAQGKDNFDSITKLRASASRIQAIYEDYFLAQSSLFLATEDPELIQNASVRVFPNPASNFVTVSYALTELAPVRFEIFDMLGRRVNDVISTLSTPGNYSQRVSIQDFSAGVYIYRVAVGSDVSTGTLVVTN